MKPGDESCLQENGAPVLDSNHSEYLRWRATCVTHYDQDAVHYDREFLVKLLEGRELRAFRRSLPASPPGSRALDFGCGTGRQSFELAARGFHVDAWDAAAGMRTQLNRKLGSATPQLRRQIRLITEDSEIRSHAYRLVCAIGLLDYYPRPELLLERCGDAVEPGGYLMVSFPDAFCPMAWLYKMGSWFVCPSFLHTTPALVCAGQRLDLHFVSRQRSPFNFALGGMLSFIVFQKASQPTS